MLPLSLTLLALLSSSSPDLPVIKSDLGSICVGQVARVEERVDLVAPLPGPLRRRIEIGRPLSQIEIDMIPAAHQARQADLRLLYRPGRPATLRSRIRVFDEAGRQRAWVELHGVALDCGLDLDASSLPASFSARPLGAAPVAAIPSPDLPEQPALAEAEIMPEPPRVEDAVTVEQERAYKKARREWCESRRDGYDTLYPGSGFVPLPWLKEPRWHYVGLEFDQGQLSYATYEETHLSYIDIRELEYAYAPHLTPAIWTQAPHMRLRDLPPVQPIGPYSLTDCRMRQYDPESYWLWAAAYQDLKKREGRPR